MPKKIQNFAKSALVKPITINVGRAGIVSFYVQFLFDNFYVQGAASLDVKQEIEYASPETRIMSLLSALQKTPPPVNFSDEKANPFPTKSFSNINK